MAPTSPITERSSLTALNAGERECLRLVSKLQSSKQIARTLGISPHTVDQRMRIACRKIGATNRVEAALMLAEHEALNGPFPINGPVADIASKGPGFPQFTVGDVAHDAHVLATVQKPPDFGDAEAPGWAARFGAPLPLSGRHENDLTLAQRMGWTLAIAAIAILIFGVLLAALTALGQLV